MLRPTDLKSYYESYPQARVEIRDGAFHWEKFLTKLEFLEDQRVLLSQVRILAGTFGRGEARILAGGTYEILETSPCPLRVSLRWTESGRRTRMEGIVSSNDELVFVCVDEDRPSKSWTELFRRNY